MNWPPLSFAIFIQINKRCLNIPPKARKRPKILWLIPSHIFNHLEKPFTLFFRFQRIILELFFKYVGKAH